MDPDLHEVRDGTDPAQHSRHASASAAAACSNSEVPTLKAACLPPLPAASPGNRDA
jgi:hypothetical protein